MNMPTLIVLALVAAVLTAILACAVRNKKKGRKTCPSGGNCAGCGMNGACHH